MSPGTRRKPQTPGRISERLAIGPCDQIKVAPQHPRRIDDPSHLARTQTLGKPHPNEALEIRTRDARHHPRPQGRDQTQARILLDRSQRARLVTPPRTVCDRALLCQIKPYGSNLIESAPTRLC